MKRLFAILLFAGALLACDKAQPEATKLDVGATEIQVPSKASVAQFTISSDAAWKVAVSEKWLVASEASGSGDALVKLALLPNTDYSSREAYVTVTAGSLEKVIKVTQSQMDGIIIDQDNVTVPYTGGSYDFPLKTNVALSFVSDVDWMSVVTSKAAESRTRSPRRASFRPGPGSGTDHYRDPGRLRAGVLPGR